MNITFSNHDISVVREAIRAAGKAPTDKLVQRLTVAVAAAFEQQYPDEVDYLLPDLLEQEAA